LATSKKIVQLKVKLEEEFKEGNIISCIYTGVENDTLLARIA